MTVPQMPCNLCILDPHTILYLQSFLFLHKSIHSHKLQHFNYLQCVNFVEQGALMISKSSFEDLKDLLLCVCVV